MSGMFAVTEQVRNTGDDTIPAWAGVIRGVSDMRHPLCARRLIPRQARGTCVKPEEWRTIEI